MRLAIDRDHEHDFSVAGWTCEALTPDAAWRGGLRALRAKLDGGAPDLAKVMIDGEIVTDEPFLPTSGSDKTFAGWFERVSTSLAPGTSILFYARALPRHDRRLFEILVSAAGPVFEAFGLARNDVDTELFCGRYSATPGGIHREFCANNHFVLVGEKSMHFWRGEGWIPPSIERDNAAGPVGTSDEEYLPTLDVGSVIDHGTSLKATAGQVLSWRNGIWHVGEATSPALAINLARYMASFDPEEETFPFERADDGEVTADWLSRCAAFLASDAADHDAALATASSFGIPGADHEVVPGEPPAALSRRTCAPLLWCALDDEVIVATHGASRRFRKTVVSWLSDLCRGPLGSAHALRDDADVQDLAAWLVANSAVTPERSDS